MKLSRRTSAITLGGSALVGVAVVIASCLLTDCYAGDDHDKCEKLDYSDFELFATKTTYEDARIYLLKADDDDLPNSFDEDSLEKEHKELRSDGCSPQVFYFIGRHSARFPDAEDIEKYNRDLYELIGKLNSSSSSRNINDSSTMKCQRRRADLVGWKSKMVPNQDNLITDLGGREERDIARRFKRLYPEFFDTQKADIRIGVTSKLRTAQTGLEFLREVQGLRMGDGNQETCDERLVPTNDVDQLGYNVDRILTAACYKYMIDNYERSFLEFHKQCDKIAGPGGKVKDPRIERMKAPQLQQRIADRLGRRLGLEPGSISAEVLDSLFNMCRFENALQNESVWCGLFERRDLEALEYIEDFNSYIKSAYGPRANPRQSCPLVKDLVEAMQASVQQKQPSRRKSYFYFSHADPMKKLLATLGMFRDDENFSEKRIADFERDLKVPKKRSWRTSLIAPFSANLAFILYKCERETDPERRFKILATVTEKPVKLGGCKDTDCSSKRFFAAYNSMRDCNLNEVCRAPSVGA